MRILALCFCVFFDSFLASKQAVCPMLAGEGLQAGGEERSVSFIKGRLESLP